MINTGAVSLSNIYTDIEILFIYSNYLIFSNEALFHIVKKRAILIKFIVIIINYQSLTQLPEHNSLL